MDIFIVGAKSIGQYGGYETFVSNLTEYHKNDDNIRYHIFCKKNGEGAMSYEKLFKNQIISDNEFIYNNARCYRIYVPQIGPAQAIIYDCLSLNKAISIIKKSKIKKFVIYILACRIGVFFKHYVDIMHKLGGKVYINPDGHEWKRSKWNIIIKKYWKLSEQLMVQNADLVICDSVNIEKYIHAEYGDINTTYIPYGAEIKKSSISDDDKIFVDWLLKNNLQVYKYYLVVGRFVPENNYETIVREFLLSSTDKKLVIITNNNSKFYNYLENKYHFTNDKRIVFAGTVYNEELLRKIRESAYAYIHGHSVGGTNPSLLEALASTKLNLMYDCCFNREVAGEDALYWDSSNNDLANMITCVDNLHEEKINEYNNNSVQCVCNKYNWIDIALKYKKCFLEQWYDQSWN